MCTWYDLEIEHIFTGGVRILFEALHENFQRFRIEKGAPFSLSLLHIVQAGGVLDVQRRLSFPMVNFFRLVEPLLENRPYLHGTARRDIQFFKPQMQKYN